MKRKRLVIPAGVTDRQAALVELFAQDRIRAIPYEERTTTFLRDDCTVRGIDPCTNRFVMIERLRAHDRGETVIEDSMRVPIVQPPPTNGFSDHQLAPVYVTSATLLSLPHPLLRSTLLRRVPVLRLFALLYTCKYLYEDALAVLREQAVAKFGPGGSPMALSLLGKVAGSWNWDWKRDGFEYISSSIAQDVIADNIHKYGSVEAVQANRRRVLAIEACLARDAALLKNTAEARNVLCDEVLRVAGYPTLMTTWAGNVYKKSVVKVVGHVFGDFKKLANRLHRYITKAAPEKLKPLQPLVPGQSMHNILHAFNFDMSKHDMYMMKNFAAMLLACDFTLFGTRLSPEYAQQCARAICQYMARRYYKYIALVWQNGNFQRVPIVIHLGIGTDEVRWELGNLPEAMIATISGVTGEYCVAGKAKLCTNLYELAIRTETHSFVCINIEQ